MKKYNILLSLLFVLFLSCDKTEDKIVVPLEIKPKLKSIVLEEYLEDDILYQNKYLYNYISNYIGRVDKIRTYQNNTKDSISYSINKVNNVYNVSPNNGIIKKIDIYSNNNMLTKIAINAKFYLFPYNYDYIENRRYEYDSNNNIINAFSRFDYLNISGPGGYIFSRGVNNFEYQNGKLISAKTYPRDTNISYPRDQNSEELNYNIDYDAPIILNSKSITVSQVNNLVINKLITRQENWGVDDIILTFFDDINIFSKSNLVK